MKPLAPILFALLGLLSAPMAFAEFTVDGQSIGFSRHCERTLKPDRTVRLPLPEGRPITKHMRTDGETVVLTMARGDNTLFKLQPDGTFLSIENEFKDEAFLEPCGRYVISPNHEDGMRYYRVSDVVEKKKLAKPVFVHPMNDFYQSASARCENGKTEMTVMIHHNLQATTLTIDDSGQVTEKAPGFHCPNFYDDADRKKLKEIVPDLELFYRIKRAMFQESKQGVDPTGTVNYDWVGWAKVPANAKRFGVTLEKLEAIARTYQSLQNFDMDHGVAEPILAPNGAVFAGLNSDVDSRAKNLKLFKKEGNECKKVVDFKESAGKPVMSRETSASGLPKYVAYEKAWSGTSGSAIALRDPETLAATKVQFAADVHGIVTYPAFSKDGKLVVLNEKGDLMFFDPSKLAKLGGCINIEAASNTRSGESSSNTLVK